MTTLLLDITLTTPFKLPWLQGYLPYPENENDLRRLVKLGADRSIHHWLPLLDKDKKRILCYLASIYWHRDLFDRFLTGIGGPSGLYRAPPELKTILGEIRHPTQTPASLAKHFGVIWGMFLDHHEELLLHAAMIYDSKAWLLHLTTGVPRTANSHNFDSASRIIEMAIRGWSGHREVCAPVIERWAISYRHEITKDPKLLLLAARYGVLPICRCYRIPLALPASIYEEAKRIALDHGHRDVSRLLDRFETSPDVEALWWARNPLWRQAILKRYSDADRVAINTVQGGQFGRLEICLQDPGITDEGLSFAMAFAHCRYDGDDPISRVLRLAVARRHSR